MWILRSSEQSQAGPLTFRISSGTKTMGRATRADFIVDASMVSRLHCQLTVNAAGRLELKDLDSTNGTFVNGRRVDRAVLVSGDRLRVGRVELSVQRVE